MNTKLEGYEDYWYEKEGFWSRKNNIQIMNAWTYAAYLKDLFITLKNQGNKTKTWT